MMQFNIDDTAVILIDHQVGTNTWASTTPLPLLQRNVIILAKFAKENENFALGGGVSQGMYFSADQIKELAQIPSREVLLARVLGGMNAPIGGFVGVLGQLVRGCVNALDALRKKRESESAAPAQASS